MKGELAPFVTASLHHFIYSLLFVKLVNQMLKLPSLNKFGCNPFVMCASATKLLELKIFSVCWLQELQLLETHNIVSQCDLLCVLLVSGSARCCLSVLSSSKMQG
ncbi:hypothetical protein SLA2020_237830 [Shorea laevis]